MAAGYQEPVTAAQAASLSTSDRRRLRVRELVYEELMKLRDTLDPIEQRELDKAAGDHAMSMLHNIRAKARRAGGAP